MYIKDIISSLEYHNDIYTVQNVQNALHVCKKENVTLSFACSLKGAEYQRT